MSRMLQENTGASAILLYRFVYTSRQRWWLLGLVVGAMLLQPLHQVFAEESVPAADETAVPVTSSANVDEPTKTAKDDIEDSTVHTTDSASQPSFQEDIVSIQDPEVAGADDGDVSPVTNPETEQDHATSTDDETASESNQNPVDISVRTSTATSAPSGSSGEVLGAITTSTAATTTATSSGQDADGSLSVSSADSASSQASGEDVVLGLDQTATPLPADIESDESVESMQFADMSSFTNDDNRYQFGSSQCVSVGDGSYYCSTKQATESVGNDVIYSQLTDSGYTDIFLQTTRGVQNITNSQYDDAAPHYDPRSETVVWHRAISGRYQIMSYDLRTKETQMITNNSINDMQPTRSGGVTAWQRWLNDAWQIVILHDGEERVLTSTQQHNIAPYSNGQYIIWTTSGVSGERKVAVYDIETDLISYITDAEAGRVSNPRFVLVYDVVLESGDIITQGFDPETGQVTPLSSLPATPPPDIPSPDPLDETRALQNKPQEEEVLEPTTGAGYGGDDPLDGLAERTSTSTTASVSTTRASTSVEIDMTQATTSVEELSEYDLVVTPYQAPDDVTSSSTATSTQPDDS